MTITTYTDREIALTKQLSAMTATATEYQQAADKMAWDHKVERDALRTAVTELEQDREANLENSLKRLAEAHSNVLKENEMLRQQLAEAQALIEASRKQEAVAYRVWRSGDDYELFFNKHSALIRGASFAPVHEVHKLYAAPVVAPDVLKDAQRYRWLREGNDTRHSKAWRIATNHYGLEWDDLIDKAMGGAND